MEAETKTEESSRVHGDESPLDSVVKPLVEELGQAAESLVQNVTDQSSAFIQKEIGNLGLVQESLIKGSSHEGAEESSEACKSSSVEQEKADDLDEKSRATHSQPTRASWTNCCGLLDVLRPSN